MVSWQSICLLEILKWCRIFLFSLFVGDIITRKSPTPSTNL